MDIDFIVQDTFALTRPQWKVITNLEEAGAAFAETVKQNYKTQEQDKSIEIEQADEEGSSEDDVDDEDMPGADIDDTHSSGDEVEAEGESEVSSKPDCDALRS